jgi:hypothetical protein
VALTEAMSFLKVGRSWVSATRAQSSSSQSVGEMVSHQDCFAVQTKSRSLARSHVLMVATISIEVCL